MIFLNIFDCCMNRGKNVKTNTKVLNNEAIASKKDRTKVKLNDKKNLEIR